MRAQRATLASAISDSWYGLPWVVRRVAVPAAVIALLVLYPKYVQQLGYATWVPQMSVMVQMCVFVTMALGLNVVVGYAGLLDLGYVAFYAAGAYIAGWFGHNITNGPNGLNPIDQLGFGTTLHNNFDFLPATYQQSFDKLNYYYWTGLVLVAFTLFCCIRLRDSRLGRAWVAIREDEIAAAAMGIPLMRTKTWAYAIGAFFGGMAGCFYAMQKSSTFPADFQLNISIFVLCMVILGGMGNVWGVVLGGVALTYLNYQGLAAAGRQLDINISTYSFGIFGAVIVGMMLLRPEGLIPSRRKRAEFRAAEEGVGVGQAVATGE
jgi:ABC-type branched-subunit amino acid transport system permease subunit